MGVAPSIITQPTVQIALVHATVVFSVVASGDPTLTYQWKKDGNNLAGKTASTLELVNVEATDQGTFTVVITNSFGSVISDDASLTVKKPLRTKYSWIHR
jgi:Immunoglobulin domain